MIDSITRIHELLSFHASERPNAEAMVDEDTRLTYSQLATEVDRVAKALIAIGVVPGDRVATLAPPSQWFWITYLAATSIGAIWMGLNPRYKERDYQYLLDDAEPTVAFLVSPYDGRDYDQEIQSLRNSVSRFVTIGEPGGSASSWENFLSEGSGISDSQLVAARAAVQPDDIAVIVYTSGTTGKPKGAMLSHKAICRIAIINAQWMGDGLESTICPAPINHVGGLNNVCMNVFAYGGRIIFYHRVDAEALYHLTVQEKPTYLVSSPTAFQMLLDSPMFSLEPLRSYKLIVFGGAKTPTHVLREFEPLGANLSSVYGQTETCGICTATQFYDPLEVHGETFGKALPTAEMKCIRTDGAECDPGESGELVVKADFVMSGYFNRPDATAEAFTEDGFLRTGDICVQREDGNYEFVGRIKEMFKSGGYNIYPLEIEAAIGEHPKVSVAAVLGMPDPKFQEVGFAFVAPKPGQQVTEAELREFLGERIANFKIPKQFSIRQALPYLPNSKLDKQSLRHELDALLKGETGNENNA